MFVIAFILCNVCRLGFSTFAVNAFITTPAAVTVSKRGISSSSSIRGGSDLLSAAQEVGENVIGDKADSNGSQRPSAIVVGGGPVGLATALMLATEPHGYDVTVYESTSVTALSNTYDPTKAFLYNVNGRGQTFTKGGFSESLQQKLVSTGISSEDTLFLRVPGDLSAPLPEPTEFRIGTVDEPSYWIPRHSMTQIMLEAVEEHNTAAAAAGHIQYLHSHRFLHVRHTMDDTSNDHKLTVTTQHDGMEKIKTTSLVVGADGWKSAVRECLRVDHLHFNKAVFPAFQPKNSRSNNGSHPAPTSFSRRSRYRPSPL